MGFVVCWAGYGFGLPDCNNAVLRTDPEGITPGCTSQQAATSTAPQNLDREGAMCRIIQAAGNASVV